MHPPKKINWNDYSDDDSSITESQSSILLKHPQLQRLKQIDPSYEYLWLILKYNDIDQKSKNCIEEIRYKQKNYAVYHNQELKIYQIKVDREYAIKLITKGINKINKISLHPKNFKKKQRKNIKSRGKKSKKEFKSEGKNSNQVSSHKKTKKYVDKETGQAPDNKNTYAKRQIQQRQRKYSKKQAFQVGNQLGNFRNKPLVQKNIIDQYMMTNDKKQKINKVRHLKSAPKKIWINKKNSYLSTKSQEDDNLQKQKEIIIDSPTIKGSQNNKKKYIEKKNRQVTQQQEQFFQYYCKDKAKYDDKRQYKMKKKY